MSIFDSLEEMGSMVVAPPGYRACVRSAMAGLTFEELDAKVIAGGGRLVRSATQSNGLRSGRLVAPAAHVTIYYELPDAVFDT